MSNGTTLTEVQGNVRGILETDGAFTGLDVIDSEGNGIEVNADEVFVFWGLSPALGPIAEWGCVPVDDLEAFEPLIDAIVGVRHAVVLQRSRHDIPGQTTMNNALSLIKPVQIRRAASPAHNLPFVNDWKGFCATLSS